MMVIEIKIETHCQGSHDQNKIQTSPLDIYFIEGTGIRKNVCSTYWAKVR